MIKKLFQVRLLKEQGSEKIFCPGYAAVTFKDLDVKERVLQEQNVKVKNVKVSILLKCTNKPIFQLSITFLLIKSCLAKQQI